MTRPLSPAAQAVLDSMYEVNMDFTDENHALAGAALRAIEDQLAQDRADPLPPDLERAVINERIRLFRRITAIAAELEGTVQTVQEGI
jgi:hypothetical protein